MKLEDMKASVESMRVIAASVLGVKAYNENHDEKGQFSSGDGGGGGGGTTAKEAFENEKAANQASNKALYEPTKENHKAAQLAHEKARDSFTKLADQREKEGNPFPSKAQGLGGTSTGSALTSTLRQQAAFHDMHAQEHAAKAKK